MPSTPTRPAAWMLAGAFLFALMGVQTHALGTRCDWLVVATTRALFMFASTAAMTLASGSRLHFTRPRTLWLRSFAGSFSLVCNFYAMTALPVSDALTLSNMNPLWIVLITSLMARRMPRVGEVAALGMALTGVVLLQRPHLAGDRLATLVAVLSSVSTAVAMLGLHRLRHVDNRAVVAHFAGVASVAAMAWLFLFRRQAIWSSHFDWATIGLLAGVCVSGTLGQLCLTRAYASGAPARVAIVGLSQVAIAAVFDVAVWGYAFTPTSLAGMALVLAPTALMISAARPGPVSTEPEAVTEPARRESSVTDRSARLAAARPDATVSR